MAVFSFGYKGDVFHLLDLPGQAAAVQELLRGRTAQKKLAWVAAHGDVSPVSITDPSARPTYRFVSSIGIECLFFFHEEEFVFIGENTTYAVKE
jgi:hypothetical protein